jgi:hypothetical protein
MSVSFCVNLLELVNDVQCKADFLKGQCHEMVVRDETMEYKGRPKPRLANPFSV